MYTLLVVVLRPSLVTTPPNIIPLFRFILLIVKLLVGEQRCPLTDGTVNCPKNTINVNNNY